MNQDTVVNLASQAMSLALKVAGPLLLAALVVGLIVSVFQAVTQIQEQSLSLIPKIAAVAVVIVVLGPWMLGQLVSYTADAVHLDPHDGGLVNAPAAAELGGQRARRLHPRARPRDAAVPASRRSFSSDDDPAARQGHHRGRHLDRADPDRDARPAHPQRPAARGGPRASRACWSALGFAFALAVLMAAVESAGSFIDVVSGFSYGELINPMNGADGRRHVALLLARSGR